MPDDVHGAVGLEPGGLLDLHNHLLPGVDDGCTSLDETLRHLERFRAQGVTELVFSPHLLAGTSEVATLAAEAALQRRQFERVVDAVRDHPVPVPRLYLGQEILARTAEELDRALAVEGVGMADGATLLVEFGFSLPYDGLDVIDRAHAEGRRVVVAHPERYRYGDRDPLRLARQWREAGARLQVNGGSILGLYTEAAHRVGVAFLREGLADLVGTDHHGDFRPHDPADIARAVEDLLGPAAVRRLYADGPREALGMAASD